MKKILAGLFAILMVFGIVGAAGAVSFTDVQYLNQSLYEGGNSFDYTHNITSDFTIPYDTLNSASLTITGNFIDDNNDSVYVESTFVGNLDTDTWWVSSSTINIASIFVSGWSSGVLNITIDPTGNWTDVLLYLNTSTLNIDYTDNAAPVPEPTTMLLLGSGLLGLGGLRRKFFKK